MRWLAPILLAACYAPSAGSGVPCAGNFDCPGDQTCDRTASPPICGGTGAGVDASSDGKLPIDAAGLGLWGTPVLVMQPTALEDDPTLTGDMLELYFNRGQTAIWRIHRASVAAPWSAPSQVIELGLATTPEISRDGTTMYFASDRAGGAGLDDIWIASRPPGRDTWDPPKHVDELSTARADSNPTPSDDQRTMVLARRLPPPQVTDVFITTRASVADAWGTPVPIAALETTQSDGDAMLTADQLTIYFYSTRGGLGDLYVATRATVNAPFGAPTPIAELNTPGFVEQDPWISPDLRHLFFASDRGGEMAIYEATR